MQRITTTHLIKMKQKAEKIVMVTAYDYPSARLVDEGLPNVGRQALEERCEIIDHHVLAAVLAALRHLAPLSKHD